MIQSINSKLQSTVFKPVKKAAQVEFPEVKLAQIILIDEAYGVIGEKLREDAYYEGADSGKTVIDLKFGGYDASICVWWEREDNDEIVATGYADAIAYDEYEKEFEVIVDIDLLNRYYV